MEKKITKAQRFEQIKAIPAVAENAELVAFIDHELELLAKKSGSRKPTKTQEQNESLKDTILDVLATFKDGATASEVLNASEEFKGMSNQKISALLKQLVNGGLVRKVKDSKKALFFVVTD